ncbi:hypothetical protein LTR62_001023 [Meristemomyces frigidus]|uniref:Bladder cancer-related BC10-like protein n=1 Tax=Meristemomyces frigidus TaxID=1508187 RepID=A0AAN7YGK3_9PEZI|nr:hypothetical protein LTR62_001023 [Meristemomyces frigidus]
MYCLRVWLPLLVFMTGASPIYIVLFLAGAYTLQRPCMYCSALLILIVFSLFDLRADWFEPHWRPSTEETLSVSESITSFISRNGTMTDTVLETASLAVSAFNAPGGPLASTAMEGVRRRIGGGNATTNAGKSEFEWLRSVLETRQLRLPCVDVIVRL